MKHSFLYLLASILIIPGCSKSDDARPADSPVAAFTFTKQAVLPFTASFISTSTGANPTVSWMWNFGDPGSGVNNTSAIQNPIHQYNAEGTYAVSLTTTDNMGLSETVTSVVMAQLRPANVAPAAFTFSISPAWLVTFTNNTTNATSYKWLFGDGSEAMNDSATVHHNYFYQGTYQVSLVAFAGAVSDTFTVPVVLP